VQGKINRGRHNDHPAGRHSIRTKQCLPLSPPCFLQVQAGCPSCMLCCPVCNIGVLWPNGWMDQGATCLGPGNTELDGDPTLPSPRKGAQQIPSFWPMFIVAKRSPISATAEHLLLYIVISSATDCLERPSLK